MAVTILPTRQDLTSYSFEIELDAATYRFDFHWNDRAAGWFFQISDVNEVPLISGRRVVVGFPLLYRFVTPGLPPGMLEAVDTSGQGLDPGLTDLSPSGRVHLLYYDASTTLGEALGLTS